MCSESRLGELPGGVVVEVAGGCAEDEDQRGGESQPREPVQASEEPDEHFPRDLGPLGLG